MSVTDMIELYNYHKQRQGIGMENQFVRHEPCFERILFVLTLDRKKMKERILIGEELQVRFRLQGHTDADVLCDATHPLGTFLADFEHDPDGEWNRFELAPLRKALHSNRWNQPALEQLPATSSKRNLTAAIRCGCMLRSASGMSICGQGNHGTDRRPVTASWIK